MTEFESPRGIAEAYESDDADRVRRVHEYLDREFQQIPLGRGPHRYDGSVPSVCERPGGRVAGR
jgi:hypothetical protein